MTPITNDRCLACPSGSIDPSELIQPKITVTWLTLEAKNRSLHFPCTSDFRQKWTPSNDCLVPTERAPCPQLSIRGVWYIPLVTLIQTNWSNLILQPLRWLCRPKMCRKTPLRHGFFSQKGTASNDHLGPNEPLSWPPSPKLDV